MGTHYANVTSLSEVTYSFLPVPSLSLYLRVNEVQKTVTEQPASHFPLCKSYLSCGNSFVAAGGDSSVCVSC